MRTPIRERLGFGTKPALLIVDMVNAFTDPQSPLGCEVSKVVEAINKLLSAFRHENLPVFFTTVAYSSPDEAPVFRAKTHARELLKAGDRMVDVDSRLTPKPTETVVNKHYASAYFGTGLAQHLHGLDVDTVLITGLSASGCVRASAVDTIQHDMRPIIPFEAVGDRDQRAQEAALRDINMKYGDVVSLKAVLEYLSTRA